MKKLLALILAALMIATLSACSDKDEGNNDELKNYLQNDEVVDHVTLENGETFYFDTVDSVTVTITGYKGSDEKHPLSIPSQLAGKTVVAISTEAFKDCTGISTVTIPETVETIGNYAFRDCAALTEINIPATVKSIGVGAFYNCTAATKVTFASGSPISTIEMHTFNGCTSLASVTVPSHVKTVKAGAFYGCTALTEVSISDGVENIEHQAFQNCEALSKVTFAGDVVVGSQAFSGASDELEMIFGAEAQVWFLEKVDNKDDKNDDTLVSVIGYVCGSNVAAHAVTVPATVQGKNVVAIDKGAFENCAKISSVVISGSVKTIGEAAFKGCTALTEVTLVNGVETIGVDAFRGCTELTTVEAPETLKAIGENAFEGCAKLTNPPVVGAGA